MADSVSGGCGCGCGTATVGSSAQTCGCGDNTKEQAIAELRALKESIDRRLSELAS